MARYKILYAPEDGTSAVLHWPISFQQTLSNSTSLFLKTSAMPSARSSWDASEVLEVDPDSFDFRCVGCSKSKPGKPRCRNRVLVATRQEASKILAQISRLDPSSSRIEGMLESLAPRVLCKSWHQNQADEVVGRWIDRIERFKRTRDEVSDEDSDDGSDETINTSRRSTIRSNATESSRTRRNHSHVPFSSLARPSHRTMVEVTTSDVAIEQPARSISTMLAEFRDLREQLELVNSRIQQTLTPTVSQAEPTSVSTSSTPIIVATPSEEPARAATEPEIQTQTPTEIDHHFDTAHTHEEHTQESHTHESHHHTGVRQPIEGECSICCEALNNNEPLTWCKTQCGQNYHQECLTLWLQSSESSKKCPQW